MDNIIDLDQFRTVAPTTLANKFLDICKETLDEEDYDDLVTAIQDPEFYNTCDEEIQDLVDGYYVNLHK